jgi:hypothetical protein
VPENIIDNTELLGRPELGSRTLDSGSVEVGALVVRTLASPLKVPMYLSGGIRPELTDPTVFGFMRTPNMGNKNVPDMPWAADNGCYSSKGERAFDLNAYLDWLKAQKVSTCLMATAPDKVGDAVVTLERSLPVLSKIREIGYPAAFVGQDRIEETSVPWDEFDVFFIGGTTEWKLGPIAKAYASQAKERSKWLHMGRVNSLKRYRYAMNIGCDSVDGTFLCFGPKKNLPRLFSWVHTLRSECAGQLF